MKKASIRDMRPDFSRILARGSHGEEVAITKHWRTVARLRPQKNGGGPDAGHRGPAA